MLRELLEWPGIELLPIRKALFTAFLALSLSALFSAAVSRGEEAKPQSPPAVPETVLKEDKDRVWDELTQILQEKDLPVASADKSSGKLTTAPKRYFRILSASFPPVQFDYRDTYTIEVTPTQGGTQVKVARKFETYDPSARSWVEKDPVKETEKVGVTVEHLFETLRNRLEQPPSQE